MYLVLHTSHQAAVPLMRFHMESRRYLVTLSFITTPGGAGTRLKSVLSNVIICWRSGNATSRISWSRGAESPLNLFKLTSIELSKMAFFGRYNDFEPIYQGMPDDSIRDLQTSKFPEYFGEICFAASRTVSRMQNCGGT